MIPFLVAAIIIGALAVLIIAFSALLGMPRHVYHKDLPYESGMVPTGTAHRRQAVPYYMVGIFFILFDVEIILLYPWAIRMRELSWDGFAKVFVFLLFVFAGLIYIWKRGGLVWRHLSKTAYDKTTSSRS